jgi:hypothetical protein
MSASTSPTVDKNAKNVDILTPLYIADPTWQHALGDSQCSIRYICAYIGDWLGKVILIYRYTLITSLAALG